MKSQTKDTYYGPVVVSDRFSSWVRHPAVWFFWDQVGSAVPLIWISNNDSEVVQRFMKEVAPDSSTHPSRQEVISWYRMWFGKFFER